MNDEYLTRARVSNHGPCGEWIDVAEFSTPAASQYKPGMRVRLQQNGRRGGGIITAIDGQKITLRPCTLEERKEMWENAGQQSEESRH